VQSVEAGSDTDLMSRPFTASLLACVLVVGSACSLFSENESTIEPSANASRTTSLHVRPIQRKIIEFGFDLPSADFIAENIEAMERRPFDGIVFRPGPSDVRRRAFDIRAWTAEDLHLGTLRKIRWRRFTDNFLHLYTASYSNMSWFNNSHWKTITANMHLYGQAVKACRCVGVAIDPEYYGGGNPWAYSSSLYPRHTFQAVQIKARERGAQFVRALQEPSGKLTLLFFFLMGYLQDDIVREGTLKDSRYALLPAFLDGILDAAEPGLTLVDGNEDAYHYTNTNQFFDVVSKIRAGARLLSPENRSKYLAQVQVGSSLFLDQVLTDKPDEHRRRHWDHNVYTALITSDRYVWVYSHQQDWWNGKIIPGSGAGIRRSRGLIRSLEPLGYDLTGSRSTIEVPAVNLRIRKAAPPVIVASVTGAEIVRVDFYRAGEVVASDHRAPYRLRLDRLPGGATTLVARAFDMRGGHGTSAALRVKIR
jgi:hypothetical protein